MGPAALLTWAPNPPGLKPQWQLVDELSVDAAVVHFDPTNAAREARSAGLRGYGAPSLDDVDRRRWQLWGVCFFVLVGVATAMIALSFWDDSLPDRYRDFATMKWMRIAMLAVVVAFCAYTIEKEVHLRRLSRILIDERVVSAALANRVRDITGLADVGRALNSVLEIDDALTAILTACLELLESDQGAIMMVGDDGRSLVTVTCRGDSYRLGSEVEVGAGIIGDAALRREPVLTSWGERTEVAVPLVSRNELLGVLTANGKTGSKFAQYDLHALGMFAEHAATAIWNARLYQVERDRVARLIEVDRLKSEFVATVSHELRTPLTSILGAANTLRRKGETIPEPQRDQLHAIIERQGRRLLHLVEDILFASRIEAGQQGLQFERVNVVDIARDAVEAARSGTGGDRVHLVGARPAFALADTAALQQVLSNLIENAGKYAPGRDPIEVSVCVVPDGHIVVAVTDHGPGVPTGDHQVIFERFHQGDGSASRSGSGVGLGLYIVRNLVEAMDGHVWCEDAAGGGARFLVSLPPAPIPVANDHPSVLKAG